MITENGVIEKLSELFRPYGFLPSGKIGFIINPLKEQENDTNSSDARRVARREAFAELDPYQIEIDPFKTEDSYCFNFSQQALDSVEPYLTDTVVLEIQAAIKQYEINRKRYEVAKTAQEANPFYLKTLLFNINASRNPLVLLGALDKFLQTHENPEMIEARKQFTTGKSDYKTFISALQVSYAKYLLPQSEKSHA
ncbi:MAG: hypothetical protein ACK5O9_02405 [Holosporales bacterium]|jgi:hypothetical protein